jgi:hypothetical protein
MIARKGRFFVRNVSSVAKQAKSHVSVGLNHNVGHAAVKYRHAKPRLGWKLQGTANEIAYDVAVSDNHFILVFLLLEPGVIFLADSGALGRSSLRVWNRSVNVF